MLDSDARCERERQASHGPGYPGFEPRAQMLAVALFPVALMNLVFGISPTRSSSASIDIRVDFGDRVFISLYMQR